MVVRSIASRYIIWAVCVYIWCDNKQNLPNCSELFAIKIRSPFSINQYKVQQDWIILVCGNCVWVTAQYEISGLFCVELLGLQFRKLCPKRSSVEPECKWFTWRLWIRASWYNYENNQQDALHRLIYYSKSALHVSGDVFAHHQEHLTVFTVSGSVHPRCCRL